MKMKTQNVPETETLKAFISRLGITMNVSPADSNPHMPEWKDANHWVCTLLHEGQSFASPFSQGLGINDEPSIEEILDCLASDAASVEHSGFDEWCSDLGFDSDSRKAERTYNACCDASVRLKDFLGATAFEQLLWHTERL